MYELFATSASHSVDIGPFLARLMFRGDKTGLHADGLELRFDEGCASMIFRDAVTAFECSLLPEVPESPVHCSG